MTLQEVSVYQTKKGMLKRNKLVALAKKVIDTKDEQSIRHLNRLLHGRVFGFLPNEKGYFLGSLRCRRHFNLSLSGSKMVSVAAVSHEISLGREIYFQVDYLSIHASKNEDLSVIPIKQICGIVDNYFTYSAKLQDIARLIFLGYLSEKDPKD